MSASIIIFLGIGVVLAGLTVLVVWLVRRRQKAIEAFAVQRGWHYTRKDTDLPHLLAGRGLELFGWGHRKKALHVMSGRSKDGDVPFRVFQYQYTTGGGRNEQTHHHLVALVSMPVFAPGLTLTKEHLLHKVWDAVGGEDIDFESAEFSKRYWVKCPNRKFAYDVIDARMMDYMLDLPHREWEWLGEDLVVYRTGGLRLDRLEPLLEMGLGFRKRIPRHVLARSAPQAKV